MSKVLVDTFMALGEEIEFQEREVQNAIATKNQLVRDREALARLLDDGHNEGTAYCVDKLALGYVIIRKKQ